MRNNHWPADRSTALAFGAAFAALACSQPAAAHTGGYVEMTCPYDGTKFQYYEQHSGTQVDQGLDLMPVGAIMAPWPLATCPTNGFVFLKEKNSDEELEKLRPLIFSPEFQALKEESPYYRASWIAERAGADHGKVSELLLKATWQVAGKSPDRYNRYAEELAKRLPADIAAGSAEEKFIFQLLYAEMLRRLGRHDEAMEFLGKFDGRKDLPSIIAALVAYQKELAQRRDSGPHQMGDAPGLGDKQK